MRKKPTPNPLSGEFYVPEGKDVHSYLYKHHKFFFSSRMFLLKLIYLPKENYLFFS